MTNIQSTILESTVSQGVHFIVTLGEGDIGNKNNIQVNSSPNNEINVQIIGSGPKGRDGLDAYEMWLAKGNEGTIDDFFNSLKGADGNSYIHPDTHSANMIIETEQKQFISSIDKLKLSGYIHDQIPSSKIWIVNHPLNKFPSVSIVDSGKNLVIGDIKYIDASNLEISFTCEFSGKAYLN